MDDYSELVYLQTLLKKVGFDVDGIQNSRKFEEVRLTFNPDLVVASAKGKNVNGLSMIESMKRRGGKPKNILIIPRALAEKLEGLKLKNVEATVKSPVEPHHFLESIAKVLDKDGAQLLEKYERVKQSLDPDNDNDVHLMRSTFRREVDSEESRKPSSNRASSSEGSAGDGGAVELSRENGASKFAESTKETSVTPEERSRRMQKWILSMEAPKNDGFPRDVVQLENKRLREEEDEADLQDLEEERRAFVRSMFNKG